MPISRADDSEQNEEAGSTLALSGEPVGSRFLSDVGGGFYYQVWDQVTYADWAGATLDLEILDSNDAVPVGTLEGALGLPQLLSETSFGDPTAGLGSTTLARGEDLELSWTGGGDLDGVTWTVHPAQGVDSLDSLSCAAPVDGPVVISWDELTAGTDPASVDAVLVNVEVHRDFVVGLVEDNSAVWTRGILSLWAYVEVVG